MPFFSSFERSGDVELGDFCILGKPTRYDIPMSGKLNCPLDWDFVDFLTKIRVFIGIVVFGGSHVCTITHSCSFLFDWGFSDNSFDRLRFCWRDRFHFHWLVDHSGVGHVFELGSISSANAD